MKVDETYRRLRKVALAQNYVSGRWMRLRRGGKTPTTSRCAMPHFPFDCPRPGLRARLVFRMIRRQFLIVHLR